MVDLLAGANYQRAAASGKKGLKRPKPLPRPGDEPSDRRFGGAGIPIDEMRRRLDRWHQREEV